MSEVIRQYRTERGMSQKDLAAAAGVDVRQIRRYEAGEQQPLLSVALIGDRRRARYLRGRAGGQAVTPDQAGRRLVTVLARRPSVAARKKIASQQVEIKQEGDLLQVATITRGLSEDEGGYHWSGELRLWDNEVLMGWYAANDGSIRSKARCTSCCTRTG